jgi:cytoskeleton protein RodZ
MKAQDQPAGREPLGKVLADAREACGLSTADVAAAVNLRETVVKAIERDDFSMCGGDVYARGHIRAIGRRVGLDVAPLLATYRARSAPPPPALPPGTAPGTIGAGSTEDGTSGARVAEAGPFGAPRRLPLGPTAVLLERRGPNWTLLGAAALAVVVLVVGVWLVGDLLGPARPAAPLGAPTARSSGAPTQAPRPGSTTPTGPGPSGTPAARDGVAVALQATGETWVSVRNDRGRTVFTGILTKGQARRFRDDRSLRLVLGNAGAVRLTVNGRSIGSAGRAGQVVQLRFGPGDPV